MMERAVERLDGSVDSLLRRITDLEKRLHRLESDNEKLRRQLDWALKSPIPNSPYVIKSFELK